MQLAKTDVELSEHVIKYTHPTPWSFRFLGMTKKIQDF
jgi:hypothetical protein